MLGWPTVVPPVIVEIVPKRIMGYSAGSATDLAVMDQRLCLAGPVMRIVDSLSVTHRLFGGVLS